MVRSDTASSGHIIHYMNATAFIKVIFVRFLLSFQKPAIISLTWIMTEIFGKGKVHMPSLFK